MRMRGCVRGGVYPDDAPAVTTRTCPVCGEAFEPRNGNQRYCCNGHAHVAANRAYHARRGKTSKAHIPPSEYKSRRKGKKDDR